MGFALCRLHDETGCSETGSQEYHIHLQDLNVKLNVPSMWKHYMTEHLVQPTQREREVVMGADPSRATGEFFGTRSFQKTEEIMLMYVERENGGYTHQIGAEPDMEFIEKLEDILANVEPLRTKGFNSEPGYR